LTPVIKFEITDNISETIKKTFVETKTAVPDLISKLPEQYKALV